MPDEPKRWQAKIWLGEKQEDAVTIYAGSVVGVRRVAQLWLLEHQPADYANLPADHQLAQRSQKYFYSDGTRQIARFSIDTPGLVEMLPAGWYKIAGVSLYPQPQPLENLVQAVATFSEQALIIEAGPEFTEQETSEKQRLARSVSHPVLHGVLVGATVSLCYMALPGRGGGLQNVVLAHESVTVIVLFGASMMGLFALIGLIIFKGMGLIEAARERQRRKPSR